MVVQLLDDFKISGVNGTRILFRTCFENKSWNNFISKKRMRFALVSFLKTNYNQNVFYFIVNFWTHCESCLSFVCCVFKAIALPFFLFSGKYIQTGICNEFAMIGHFVYGPVVHIQSCLSFLLSMKIIILYRERS